MLDMDGSCVLVSLFYENVHDFCSICHCIGHDFSKCCLVRKKFEKQYASKIVTDK